MTISSPNKPNDDNVNLEHVDLLWIINSFVTSMEFKENLNSFKVKELKWPHLSPDDRLDKLQPL